MRLLFTITLALLAAHALSKAEVHMLVPGFTVVELPVKLSNINNLRFAPVQNSASSRYSAVNCAICPHTHVEDRIVSC